MTDKELQDLIGLKKYEQPEEGYFDDFLSEFQQRQRAEMLNTSARKLLAERAKTWFSEFGAVRWIMGAGAAYAAVAILIYLSPNQETAVATVIGAPVNESSMDEKELLPVNNSSENDEAAATSLSMAYIEPVDFSEPAPAFFADERIF